MNGVVTLIATGKTENKGSVIKYAGVAKRTWGKTTEDIEEELKKDRDSWGGQTTSLKHSR